MEALREAYSKYLGIAVDYAWGMPLIILLIGGGLILMFHSRLLPLTGFIHSIKLITGKFHHSSDEKAPGQITHFQALTNALSATIGLGNISGVAVAIQQGGAGAIFWMWVVALIGMNTKFFECTLSVMYRGKDHLGEVQGGPMYVIKSALDKKYHFLAYMFAVCGLIGTMAMFQSNQLAVYVTDNYSMVSDTMDPMFVGIFCAAIVAVVAKGGVKSIAAATSRVVPFMCVFYVFFALLIIFLNVGKVPGIFSAIFTQAIGWNALAGGIEGAVLAKVLQIGVKRAAFSNEAGMGTAAMAHSNVKTSEPISEGYVAMMGPFLDTIIVCTLTALVILSSVDASDLANAKLGGILLTTKAFESSLPNFGSHFLGIAIFLFSITTMIGMVNYNEKCWNFLFRGKKYFGRDTLLILFCTSLIVGSVSEAGDVVNLLDLGFALMAIPNMIATILLAGKVKEALGIYRSKYLA